MRIIKTLSIYFIFCLLAVNCKAQFKLTGKVINYTPQDSLKINIPLVFGFHQQNSISIPIHNDGSFEIVLPINEKKFANLIFKRKFHTFLLAPKQDLNIILNANDTSATLKSGTALAVNGVVQTANIEEYPFFMSSEKYQQLPLAELEKQVLLPYFARRDEKIKEVEASSISKTDKQLISTEVKSIAYNYLSDFARTQITNRALVDSLLLAFFEPASTTSPILPAGPNFYAFIDNYLRFLETKAFLRIKNEKIPSNQPIPYFGISLDSANIFVKKYSKAQWRFLGATKNLDPQIVELYGYQQLVNAAKDKDYRPFKGLAEAFQASFPSSKFMVSIKQQSLQLDELVRKNESNDEIRIIENYQSIATIDEIVKKFPGKVIYLDIWGTWCGPCKEELYYLPALKSHFKNKDIVFVYLDVDDDDKENAWKEFIRANAMTGIHLRKTRQSIDPIWKELLANSVDKAEFYPQYFIFDPTGKLVVTKAKRPSERELLYAQIESYLPKK